MIQNNLIARVWAEAWDTIPAWLIHRIISPRRVAMTQSLQALDYQNQFAGSLVSLTVNWAGVEALESTVGMDEQLRPERLIMPGRYALQSVPRAQSFNDTREHGLGYLVRVTSRNFVMAWRV